jgi:beta-lactamase regulating signal transducer with metallopeptidase domain
MAPRLRGRHRAMLWWLAAAKLLVALVPIAPIAFAVLPPSNPAAETSARSVSAPTEGLAAPAYAPAARDTTSIARSGAIAAWAVGVIVLLASSLRAARRARAWRRAGEPVRDPGLVTTARIAAAASGLRGVPRVLLVSGLPSPLVVGLLRPAVLLPSEALGRLGAGELEMVLEHEMAHIARRDLWLGFVPAVARRVFFFHPLAWLAEREYAIARESACDEAVVDRAGTDAFAYGKLLLLMSAVRPAATAALSPHSMLRRRLEMIESAVRRNPLGKRAAWALVALAAVAFVPVRLVARESLNNCLGESVAKDSAYVIVHGDTHTMCGDMRDVRMADRSRRGKEDLIWFRVGDDTWVIRDREIIAHALELFGSQKEAVDRQARLAELHAKIAALPSPPEEGVEGGIEGGVSGGVPGGVVGGVVGGIGDEQARLAEVQAELATTQARTIERDVRARVERDAMAQAEAELAYARAATIGRQASTRREAVGADARLQADLLARTMDQLGREMDTLGRRQDEVGFRQEALGKMLEDALKNGTAAMIQ